MPRLNNIEPVFVDEIPDNLEDGKIYISKLYSVAVHLCACGCKEKCVTPLKNGWTLTENNGKVTLCPSIGNWSGEKNHHAHYYIIDNRIKWC